MSPAAIRIGTRGSPLALRQSGHVAESLRSAVPGLEVELKTIRTAAEKFPDRPPEAIGVGIFTREIDEELLEGKIDLAVHSLKDMASAVDPRLTIAAVPPRESPFDAFVGALGGALAGAEGAGQPALWDLPPGAAIGTSSPRRKAQVLHRRPDLLIVPLRGNVETRIRKAREGGLAGTILAQAGLRRLGREELIRHVIPAEWIIPAVGQGALGIVARADRPEMVALARRLEHPASRARITAERAFLGTLRGGCQVPAGALAEIEGSSAEGERLLLRGVLASPDGARSIRGEKRGPVERGEEIGRALAEELLSRGGAEALQAARGGAPRPEDFQS